MTGGAGFLGLAIARLLRSRGAEVRSLSRGAHPELARFGIEAQRGDVADAAAVLAAAKGCDTVFHVAARVGGWGARSEFFRTNVEGTRNVVDACREAGVRRLVFTSTPSVVHTGGDIEGGDESLPYATHFDAAYPETKAVAEQHVLAENDAQLATTALRPHLVWGPGDNQLLPRLLERARAGRAAFVGSGEKLVDMTYIDNAAEAHVLAAERLAPGAACAGRAYFIAQGEPAPARQLVNAMLAAADLPPITRRVPVGAAWLAAAGAELYYHLTGRDDEPPLTRFAARQLATAHWYDLSAARRDLGYEARVSMQEGLAILRAHLAKTGDDAPDGAA